MLGWKLYGPSAVGVQLDAAEDPWAPERAASGEQFGTGEHFIKRLVYAACACLRFYPQNASVELLITSLLVIWLFALF